MTALVLWIAAAAVVVVVGVLLVIVRAARDIERAAGRALRAVEEIRERTDCLGMLAVTNAVGSELVHTVRSIREGTEALADALAEAQHEREEVRP